MHAELMSDDYRFPFEKLRVWQDARVWVKAIYVATRAFPDSEKFGLVSQLNRASVSVPTNLAEGSGRTSRKDQAHFTQLAYSSLMESMNLLIIARDLEFVSESTLCEQRSTIAGLSAQMNALHMSQLRRVK